MAFEKFPLPVLKELGRVSGSIKLQKIIYFVQQFLNIKFYNYYMHNFGPYSDELSSDLKSLGFSGAINIDYNPPYSYTYNKKIGDELVKDFKSFNSKIKRIIVYLSELDSTELESIATIHFILLEYLKKDKISELDNNWNEVLEIFKLYKGKRFTEKDIKRSKKKLIDLFSIN